MSTEPKLGFCMLPRHGTNNDCLIEVIEGESRVMFCFRFVEDDEVRLVEPGKGFSCEAFKLAEEAAMQILSLNVLKVKKVYVRESGSGPECWVRIAHRDQDVLMHFRYNDDGIVQRICSHHVGRMAAYRALYEAASMLSKYHGREVSGAPKSPRQNWVSMIYTRFMKWLRAEQCTAQR